MRNIFVLFLLSLGFISYGQTIPTANIYNLVFGDTTFSVSLMGIYSRANDKMGADIQKAIQTICYDKSFKVDPFAHAIFTLDDSRTRIKFKKYSATIYMYAIKDVELSDDNPTLMVLTIPEANTVPEITADIMLNNLRQKGLTVLSTENAVTGKTNGLSSFQREVYVMMDGKRSLLYQHVVIIGKNAVLLQGQATANLDTYLKDFQALSSTIRKK